MSDIVKSQMASAIEQVVINGDLSKLNADQRVSYVKNVCDSLGLNPTTRPFEYIVLNGKLTLYATRSASEQLRKIHGVSILGLDRTMMNDAGLYQVVARGRDSQGREDEASGVVNIAGLKGENLANALLKCETKAKRRLTLSICGLGFLDETEVSDIPGAAAPVQATARVVVEKPALPAETVTTNAAINRLRAKVEEAGIMVDVVEDKAVSEQPAPKATPSPRKGGGAPAKPESTPTSPEGNDPFIRVTLKFVDRKTTKNNSEFVSVKTSDNQQFNCWDSGLFDALEECKGSEVSLLVEYPPEGAPAAARPKIVELRRSTVEAEVPADIPF